MSGASNSRGVFARRTVKLPSRSFKALVREQFNMLLIDQEAALAAIPAMLPSDAETRQKAFDLIKQVLGARGEMSPEDEKRMSEVARLFAMDKERSADQIPFRRARKEPQARTS